MQKHTLQTELWRNMANRKQWKQKMKLFLHMLFICEYNHEKEKNECAARSQSPQFNLECWQNIMKEKFQLMEHCFRCDLRRNFWFATVDQRWSTIDLADIRRARIRCQRQKMWKIRDDFLFLSFLKNLHFVCSLISLNKRWIYLETRNQHWLNLHFLFFF